MAIDTNEKKLSLIDMGGLITGIPLPDGSLDQGDNQHLLDEYSGILFDAAVASEGQPQYPSGWFFND